ncbi:hypothetical protein ACWCSH_47930, partial [Streptosporangium sp. NPDC001682]
ERFPDTEEVTGSIPVSSTTAHGSHGQITADGRQGPGSGALAAFRLLWVMSVVPDLQLASP